MIKTARSRFVFTSVMLICFFSCFRVSHAEEPTVRKIWDDAPHNAFTDLAYWRGEVYCAFREGSGHVPGTSGVDGTSRIIASEDGETWRSVGLIAANEIDLRDPKLSVTPDDRLMVVMGGSYYEGTTLLKRVPQVSFLDDPEGEFSAPETAIIDPAIATSTDWLWRVTWHEDTAYGVVYQPNPDAWGLQLVSSKDGIHFDHVATLDLPGRPNETTVRFEPDGTMRLIVRNEASGGRGHYGVSDLPYTEWNWTDVPHRLGGPNILRLESGDWILGTRCYDPPGATTILERLSDDGRVDRIYDFPSGGDTSYPGMILLDDVLWFSYYSSHEGRTSIYLAKIDVSWIKDAIQRLDSAETP
jgi:hypothetical protein